MSKAAILRPYKIRFVTTKASGEVSALLLRPNHAQWLLEVVRMVSGILFSTVEAFEDQKYSLSEFAFHPDPVVPH